MLIPVTVGGETRYLPDRRTVTINGVETQDYQVPTVIGGSRGFMESNELIEKVVYYDDENETATATEYWEGSELRHRSLELHLKKGLTVEGTQADFC